MLVIGWLLAWVLATELLPAAVDHQSAPARWVVAGVAVLAFFAEKAPCTVGLEACGSAHHWAREISKLGHEVRLIPASKEQLMQIAYRAEFVFDSVIAGLFGASFLRHEVEEQFLLMTAEMKRREPDLPAATLQQSQHAGE